MERILTHVYPCVVSKSDSDHGSEYDDGLRTLGLMPAGTCIGKYPLPRSLSYTWSPMCQCHIWVQFSHKRDRKLEVYLTGN